MPLRILSQIDHLKTVGQSVGEGIGGSATAVCEIGNADLTSVHQTAVSLVHTPGGEVIADVADGGGGGDNAFIDRTILVVPKLGLIAAGEDLARVLNENGIGAIHCTVMHDEPTLSGSYDRSAETVKRYLAQYPSIEYVIDLHRDAVTDADGALVRAVTEENGARVAQVMAVVGTEANGTEHPRWEENLALALALREALNADGRELCRPVSLRNASFHQELARYSLLLEIGSSANSPEEAKRAAQRVGDALVKLILGE